LFAIASKTRQKRKFNLVFSPFSFSTFNMIIDCHTHIWPDRSCLGQAEKFSCLAPAQSNSTALGNLCPGSQQADMTFILGFVSDLLEAEISNDSLVSHARANSDSAIVWAGVDPTRQNCLDQVNNLAKQDVFAGLTVSPACQGFHPCHTRAMMLYELAQELRLPIYFLQGELLPHRAVLPYADPTALDEIARQFPHLNLIISHLGFPWVEQTLALLAKHANIFSDTAGLADKSRQAYRCLGLACEYHVCDKLLLGSDFPRHTVRQAVEAIYNANKLSADCVMPPLPRDQLRAIVERDSLTALGLQRFKTKTIQMLAAD
jgi:uncharacterized protein